MKAKWRKWSQEEKEYLRQNYSKTPCVKIAQYLGRSIYAVHGVAAYMHLNCFKQVKVAYIPTETTPALAYILGVLCGDGHISTRLVLADSNHEFVETFQHAIKNVFKTSYSIRTFFHHLQFEDRKVWEGTRYEITVRQKSILQFVSSLGDFRTRTWQVPTCVRNGNLAIKGAFIRGLFDSEASVHLYKRGNQNFASIEVGVINPAINEVRDLLAEFDIKSTVTQRKDGLTILAITNLLSLILYDKCVGFSITEKNEKLRSVLRLPKTGPYVRELRRKGYVRNVGLKSQVWIKEKTE